MGKVNFLFIYPDFLEATRHIKTIPGNYNEGIASISAVLRRGGHNTCLYHQTYMPDKEGFIERVKSYSPDIIGFTVRTSALDFVAEMAGWLDEALPGVFVMAGGYHPSLAPDEVIGLRGIDAVCLGEGEYVTLDFVDSFAQSGQPDTKSDSFWIKCDDGTICKNPVRPFVEDLDTLPFPDLDLFNIRRLKSNATQNTAEVIVSRGCLYSCTYCANAQLRNIYPDKKRYTRFRSPENAVALLEKVLEKDPEIEAFNFNDAILNMYTDWFYAFTALYKERIGKKYTCNLRFDHLDEKMARELADSGCYLVTIGLENGNEDFRKKYLKRVMKNEHIIEVSHMLKRFGIIVYTYNIIGLPFETLALSLETIKLNARMHTDNVIASNFFPYPATEIRRIAEEAGFLDPSVSPHDPVQLRMPNYPRRDFMYVKFGFLKLIRKYRKIYQKYEGDDLARRIARLDGKIMGKRHPRGLIGAVRRRRHLMVVSLKRNVSRLLPAIYKKLRARSIKSKA
ncbi:MAG: B12-binding domain-containing radical SAM protein [Oscillospiraceae bacterium]|nr:B12-binding domain-containing radical SAM protein [Oscillospiraceae bacterium]